MINLERILCPATLTSESDEALRYAASLADAYEAELLLCHCLKGPPIIRSLRTVANDGNHDQIKKALHDSLARYLGAAAAKVKPEVIIIESGGDVGEEIVRTARERRVDLIVMRSRESRVAALLGSTAEQVSRTASCPVLVIRTPDRSQAQSGDVETNSHATFRRVLVAHDFSSSSELALSYALSIAQKFRAELHLIHVLPEPEEDEPEIAWTETSVETAYHRALHRLQASVPEEIYKRNSVTHAVRWGKPYREVLAYAREQNADLVCMGALGSDFGLQALFGSNVDRVLRQASCPVLVARPLKPATPILVNRDTTVGRFGKTLAS